MKKKFRPNREKNEILVGLKPAEFLKALNELAELAKKNPVLRGLGAPARDGVFERQADGSILENA